MAYEKPHVFKRLAYLPSLPVQRAPYMLVGISRPPCYRVLTFLTRWGALVGSTIAPKASDYFKFLDGLRAISILSVVLYHVGVPYITGGFIGVDVFFVISGFLIIGQISKSLEAGIFSFSEFWSRRALRILPTYLLVVFSTAIIGSYVLVLPNEFTALGEQILYSALMAVNFLFLQQQGYFDADAATKPLLHLWSLAVEEQFYLVAPLLMVGVWAAVRRLPSRTMGMLFYASIFVMSLAGCILLTGTGDDKNYAFYLMPLRAWEFMVGGALAVMVNRIPRLSLGRSSIITIAGIAVILGAAFSFSSKTLFPSVAAAAPVAGAAMVIFAGIGRPDASVVRLLGSRPMAWIGLLSYAWYLWHWPLLSLWRTYNFGARDLLSDSIVGFVALLLSIVTYVTLERPIRRWREHRRMPLHWTPAAAGLAGCFAIALAGLQFTRVQATRIEAETPPQMVAGRDNSNFIACSATERGVIARCMDGLGANRSAGFMFGDSHTRAIFPHLQRSFAEKDIALTSLMGPACPSIRGVVRDDGTMEAASCLERIETAFEYLREEQNKPTFAILHSRWVSYQTGKRIKLADTSGENDQTYPQLLRNKLRETVTELQSLGVERVLVVGALPDFRRVPSTCLARSDRYGLQRELKCATRRRISDRTIRPANALINDAVSGLSNVRWIDPSTIFCDRRWCRPYSKNTVYFYDRDHLNEHGAKLLYDRFKVDFQWVSTGEEQVARE